MVKLSIYTLATLNIFCAGCTNQMQPTSEDQHMAIKHYKIAGQVFTINVPTDLSVITKYESGKPSEMSYIYWGRAPWSPRPMIEQLFRNKLIVTYYSWGQYESMRINEGRTRFPDLYAFSASTFHTEIKTYELPNQSGIVFRYDVKNSNGVFCLAGVVYRIDKYHSFFEADSYLMKTAISSFNGHDDRDKPNDVINK
ncbi:hypothetical protein OpiT1DRAFT_00316 [Opitutaceae bacterium TAV1]|nr:hypothetical protein OpiT1DRAFT_00316 [Opitutaceae bacterium TAV1]